jgi:protein-L-isoaspartate(D-aspartate) O-methyltransferase
MMKDTLRDQGKRKLLVQELQEKKGIDNTNVLKAIGNVPRHLFFDKVFHDNFAYKDVAFPIAAGQTISQPYTVATQSSLLKIEKGMKVLEVGTGSGYQTAVLLELGAKVYSIERQRELFQSAKVNLSKLNYRANLFFGDGYIGKEAFAPFDRIIVTCGAPFVPEELINQLAPNGIMVVPVGEGVNQTMILIEKSENGEIIKTEHGSFSFVPMLNDKQY